MKLLEFVIVVRFCFAYVHSVPICDEWPRLPGYRD